MNKNFSSSHNKVFIKLLIFTQSLIYKEKKISHNSTIAKNHLYNPKIKNAYMARKDSDWRSRHQRQVSREWKRGISAKRQTLSSFTELCDISRGAIKLLAYILRHYRSIGISEQLPDALPCHTALDVDALLFAPWFSLFSRSFSPIISMKRLFFFFIICFSKLYTYRYILLFFPRHWFSKLLYITNLAELCPLTRYNDYIFEENLLRTLWESKILLFECKVDCKVSIRNWFIRRAFVQGTGK